MQISQSNNQTSFGIKSIKFDDYSIAKELFAKATKKISPDAMAETLKEIKNIKPKIGPDVDAFIGTHSQDYGGHFLNVYADEGKMQSLGTKFSHFWKNESEITPKSMIKAFKNLVKSVDAERLEKNAGKNLPDDLLSTIK